MWRIISSRAGARVGLALFLGCGLWMTAGCQPGGSALDQEPVPVVIVRPAQTNGLTEAVVERARAAFPGADLYPAISRLARASQRHVLLVVQPELLDAMQWRALQQSCDAGTPLLIWGRHPLARLQEDPPDVTLISPAYRWFNSEAAWLRRMGEDAKVRLQASVQSPFPRPLGLVSPSPVTARWIPLAETEDASGQARAWPLSLWVEAPGPQGFRAWGWLGLDDVEEGQDLVISLLQEAARRLHQGCFLIQAGPPHRALSGGSLLELSARVACADTGLSLRVVAELLDTDNRVARRVSAPAKDWTQLNLGTLPRIPDRHRDYRLRMMLVGADHDRVYDEMVQPLRVLPAVPPSGQEYIRVTGARFTLGRRPIFILGAPLRLRNGVGLQAEEPGHHPLDPEVFDTAAIKRALDQAQEAGLNLLRVNLAQTNQAPQLRWLMEEMRPRSMWIQLAVAGLDPLELDLGRARALLEAAPVLKDPVLFAVEAGSRSALGAEDQRRHWDGAWREWLIEQYGSVEHAEEVLGQKVWRDAESVTGPPDEALAVDTEERAWVAVYRRFVDDLVSRRLGQVRRFLAGQGNQSLLGACRGWGGPPGLFPLDPGSGSAHLDFVQLDAGGLHEDDAARPVAVHSALYARGMNLGKPVIWANVGDEAGRTPGPATLERQALRVQGQMELALRSHAAGLLVRPLPGGQSPADQMDEGFTDPDGRWRPAGEALRRFNQRVRREATVPPSWAGRLVNRDRDARGLYGWLLKGAGEGLEPGVLAEVRPEGFGRNSYETPLESVGGRPHADPAPWSWLNAEWGLLRAGTQGVERAQTVKIREALELELWNTGSARWINTKTRRLGAVWVRVLHPGGREEWLPVAETGPGHSFTVKWTPADAGVFSLRAWSGDQGGFGEPLSLTVVD